MHNWEEEPAAEVACPFCHARRHRPCRYIVNAARKGEVLDFPHPSRVRRQREVERAAAHRSLLGFTRKG